MTEESLGAAVVTPSSACESLAALGIRLAPEDVRLERRDGRWLARLPNDRVAWFPAEDGHGTLARERRLLRLLALRCGFGVPRVLAEGAGGTVDVRSMVTGLCDPGEIAERVRADPGAARRLGASLGAVLAEQHTAVAASDVADWLPDHPYWPRPRSWIGDHLPRVVADPELCGRADAVIGRYESLDVAPDDRVLVHGDLGFHNIAVDPTSLALSGIFDWEGACWADRHIDFRYLIGLEDDNPLLDAALGVYELTVGRALSRERILLHNAACAITFLAFRAGVPADERWCGRTLEEDLRWTHLAIARVE